MAVSSAFVGAKLEALMVSNTASASSMSASASAAPVGLLCKPAAARAKRVALIRRNSGIIRGEVAPEALVRTENADHGNAASSSASASSLSALEQLKTSAADSMFAFPCCSLAFYPVFLLYFNVILDSEFLMSKLICVFVSAAIISHSF